MNFDLLHKKITEFSKKKPGKIAIRSKRSDISYFHLEQSSNRMANFLHRKIKELQCHSRNVIVALDRSPALIESILGVFKSGCVFVPVDPLTPENRIKLLIHETHSEWIITSYDYLKKIENIRDNFQFTFNVIIIDESIDTQKTNRHIFTIDPSVEYSDLDHDIQPSKNCYIYFTSGSTGKPKGVLGRYLSLSHFINWEIREFGINENFNVSQLTNPTFDPFLRDILVPLAVGGTCCIPEFDILMNPVQLIHWFDKHHIAMLHIVPSLFKEIVRTIENDKCLIHLRYIFFAGELLRGQDLSKFLDIFKNRIQLVNLYGPTETTLAKFYYPIQLKDVQRSIIPVGKPIDGTQALILSKDLKRCISGNVGEIYIRTPFISSGYYNNKELTRKVFLKNPFSNNPQDILYKTGDLGRILPDGNVELTGRVDYQVKIRGMRVELGEIENRLLQFEGIKETLVTANEDNNGNKILYCYFVPETGFSIDIAEVKTFLFKELPQYMVPSFYFHLEKIPLNPNGKVDRNKLPLLQKITPSPGNKLQLPGNIVEDKIAKIFKEVLQLEEIDINGNFFDLGGNSLKLIEANTKINRILERELPPTKLFEFPTINSLSQYIKELDNNKQEGGKIYHRQIPSKDISNQQGIAVIGMSCRFPGANNADEFWENLKNGVEGISFLSDEELLDRGISPELVNNPNYVRATSEIQDKEYFDAAFFGYSPREAELLDPQIRIFHECSWEALENSGIVPVLNETSVGVFAGAVQNFGWESRVLLSGKSQTFGKFAASRLTGIRYLCTRLSYKLNLQGPSVTIQTACSTSLVAVHMACRAIKNNECDIAIAGGITALPEQGMGYLYEEGMIFSPDGHCRSFSTLRNGTIFGEGTGVVVLKSYESAVADKDNIYAVIKGSAINNDGNRKVGFTASGVPGQVEVVRSALTTAGVDPKSITYLEAHGTATQMGDPIELEALTQAFETQKKNYCFLGSVKSNFGHLDAASGIAGFIKALLILKNRTIPPSLHSHTRSQIDHFKNSPFKLNQQLIKLKKESYPLRVGINSLGMGGTNAHVILEEAPKSDHNVFESSKPYQLVILSAKSPSALKQMTKNLLEFLKKNPTIPLEDVAYTLQLCRTAFPYRCALVCPSDTNQAINTLSSPPSGKLKISKVTDEEKPIIFMFSGLGSQYVNMGRKLYQAEKRFQKEIDRCFAIAGQILGYNLKEILYPQISTKNKIISAEDGQEISNAIYSNQFIQMNQIENSQMIIFIFEYALAKLIIQWGIKPSAMVGYSFGEYVAACLADVFSLEDALKLIAYRGQLIQKIPQGAMLSVPLSANEVLPLLNENLSIAIDNGPSSVIAGTTEAINALEKQLKKKKYLCMRVQSSHALHSKMMNPLADKYKQKVAKVQLNEPQCPYISGITGNWITPEQATDPGYWARHLLQTVKFADGVRELAQMRNAIFIEIGPGRDLSTLIERFIEKKPDLTSLHLIKHPGQKISGDYFFYNKIGRLWMSGVKINWEEFNSLQNRQKIPLPTYPFERQRYWIEDNPINLNSFDTSVLKTNTRYKSKKNLADWFYTPSWKRNMVSMNNHLALSDQQYWLLFCDDCGWGDLLGEKLKEKGMTVIIVKKGKIFQKKNRCEFTLNPQEYQTQYNLLFAELAQNSKIPNKIIHLWGITSPSEFDYLLEVDKIKETQDFGFNSILSIAHAFRKYHQNEKTEIVILTNNMQEVIGMDGLCPTKSPVLSIVNTIPFQYKNMKCRSIDLVLPQKESFAGKKLIEQLIWDIVGEKSDLIVAYRNSFRWLPQFESIHFSQNQKINPILKKEGVYLLIGGFEGIEILLAKHLIKDIGAKFIIADDFAASRNRKRETEFKQKDGNDGNLHNIHRLKNLGVDLLLTHTDDEAKEQIQPLVQKILRKYGHINGVLYSPALQPKEILQNDGPGKEPITLTSRIQELLYLFKTFTGIQLDFFAFNLHFSLIPGRNNHTKPGAIGNFLNAFAKYKYFHEGMIIKSINWEGLQELKNKGGIHHIPGFYNRTRDESDKEPFTGDFKELFNLIFNENIPETLISPQDPNQLIENVIDIWEKPAEINDEKKIPIDTVYQRPELESHYAAPNNDTEKILANAWSEFFGFQRIGIYDDFFELGGDSLKAMKLSEIIGRELDVEIPIAEFFNHPTIEKLSKHIEIFIDKRDLPMVVPVEKKTYYPLSSAQRRLFVLHQLLEENTAYNEQSIIIIEGEMININWLDIFKRLIKRHESFRTSFDLLNGEPHQIVHNDIELSIPRYFFKKQETETAINKIVHEFVKPFCLEKAPLLRVGVIEIENAKQILMIDMHHIIMDGASKIILINEIVSLFMHKKLPKRLLQYRDFSLWQNRLTETGKIKKQEKYWLKEFQDEIPILNLPVDNPRPSQLSFEGSCFKFAIDPEIIDHLKQIASTNKTSLFIVFLSIFKIFLARMSGQDDIVVGTLVEGRRTLELQNIIGMFVNTLAIRSYPSADKNFIHFLKDVSEQTLNAFENQDYQFENLVENIAFPRDPNRNPLFDVMFIFQNLEFPGVNIPGLKISPYKKSTSITKFDLRFDCYNSNKGMSISIEYSTKLFERATIQRFAKIFRKITFILGSAPRKKIKAIEIIDDAEKCYILERFNNTQSVYPNDQTLIRLFEEQVIRKPDHISLSGSLKSCNCNFNISYFEANQRADNLAYVLRQKGSKPNSIISIMSDLSSETILGILGILKAGCAFLPIDPGYPDERIKFILADSSTTFILNQKKINEYLKMDNPAHKNIDSHPIIGAQNPAYIIYTSGTTGNPRGVFINQQNIVNYIHWGIKRYVKDERCNFPLYTSLSFDLTITSIFTPLLSGNSLVIYRGDQKEILIHKVIRDNQVEVIKLTPSHLKVFLDFVTSGPITQSNIKRFILGGEALETELSKSIIDRLHNNIEIFNEYGPTETTVGCMIYKFSPQFDRRRFVPIGTPIDNVQILILDNHHELLPLGIPGEIYISGDGVACGYLNNPEMTRNKFISFYKYPTKPSYRSGDMGRHLPEGGIEFLGRRDNQVKIRGYRIELEEIENNLMNYRKKKSILSPNENIRDKDLKAVKRCRKCLLSEKYPTIEMNEKGICNVCLEYEKNKDKVEKYFKQEEDFLQLIKEFKGKNEKYDCLLLFSGGKDSTYVLYRLMDMGLKVLTFTFDNGYISKGAISNIKRTTSELNVENIIYSEKNMNKIFLESLNTNQSVCHGCWNVLNTFGAQIANEKGIQYIISGLSRGQIVEMRLEGLFQQGIYLENEIEESLSLFRRSFHYNNKFSQLIDEEISENLLDRIKFIDFFRYFNQPVSEIKRYLLKKGWTPPADTGFCSSNCIINDVGIFIHLKEKGYHFYEPQISWDCRLGSIPRAKGLNEISFRSNLQHMDSILNEIGYYNPTIKETIVLEEKKINSGDQFLTAYLVADDPLDISDLKEYLSNHLPGYMIPQAFVQVEKIPLTLNGKVDKTTLTTMGKKLETGVEYVVPKSKLEIKIAKIWKEVLNLNEVGINENFFDMGGTSMDIIRANSKLKKFFKRDISLIDMYKYTTIASFSEFLDLPGEEVGAKDLSKREHVNRRIEKSKAKKIKRRKLKAMQKIE